MKIERIVYDRLGAFQKTLTRRVDDYFSQSGLDPRNHPRMHAKAIFMIVWLTGSYLLLVFVADSWVVAVPLAISLGLAMAGTGFNVTHDGNHGAISRSNAVNRMAGCLLDLMGASSYIWRRKHNSLHHCFPNVDGIDEDIDLGKLCRMAPQQQWCWFHRFQHLYAWALYGALAVKWYCYDDFASLLSGKIGKHTFARPRGLELTLLVGGKILAVFLAVTLPLMLHPWWAVLPLCLLVSVVLSLTLSVVFQMAHCTGEASFCSAGAGSHRDRREWAVHQVESTVNFAAKNKLLTWYIGALNYQIEHHLFPRISHIHLPAISGIVSEVCREYGVRHYTHGSLAEAIRAHYAWLRLMGHPPATRSSERPINVRDAKLPAAGVQPMEKSRSSFVNSGVRR